MTIFSRTGPDNKDFQMLVALLDHYLSVLDGDEHAFYAKLNTTDTICNTIVCYVDDDPVGCAAFRAFDTQIVEIKRMYVQPAHRGKGLGLMILKELEIWAAELNNTGCVLETSKKQPNAISLYKKAGYQIIKNYGQYLNVENSVCMKKEFV